MKRIEIFCLTVFLALLSVDGFSQTASSQEAFSKYQAGDYRSAIKIYHERIAKKAYANDQFMLALCYLKTDSTEQSKSVFDEVIRTKGDQFGLDPRAEACDYLAKIFLKEKNYHRALHYYQLKRAIVDSISHADFNSFGFHFFNSYNQARCYSALKTPDSSIFVLNPYMFTDYRGVSQWASSPNKKDSLIHDTVARYYVALLQKRYSTKQIKSEFKKAEQSFKFTEKRKPKDQNGFLWIDFQSSIDIYGLHIILMREGIGNKEEKILIEIQQPKYTKAYNLEHFRELTVCKLVRNL